MTFPDTFRTHERLLTSLKARHDHKCFKIQPFSQNTFGGLFLFLFVLSLAVFLSSSSLIFYPVDETRDWYNCLEVGMVSARFPLTALLVYHNKNPQHLLLFKFWGTHDIWLAHFCTAQPCWAQRHSELIWSTPWFSSTKTPPATSHHITPEVLFSSQNWAYVQRYHGFSVPACSTNCYSSPQAFT